MLTREAGDDVECDLCVNQNLMTEKERKKYEDRQNLLNETAQERERLLNETLGAQVLTMNDW
jgi:antitoxin component of MazEF toxin-antitoxin module